MLKWLRGGACASMVLVASAAIANAQAVNCNGVVQGEFNITNHGQVMIAPEIRGAQRNRLQKQSRDNGLADWSKTVAQACPGLDPSWQRARQKSIRCGFFSSSLRYTCTMKAKPARKRA